jgi:hypothetical protein
MRLSEQSLELESVFQEASETSNLFFYFYGAFLKIKINLLTSPCKANLKLGKLERHSLLLVHIIYVHVD